MAAPQYPSPVGFTGFAVTAMDTGQEGLVYLGNPIFSQLKARNVGDQAVAKYQTIICVGREQDYLLVAASTLWTVSAMGEVGTDLYPKTDKALLFGRGTPDFRRWLQAHLWDLYVYGALKQDLAVDAGKKITGTSLIAKAALDFGTWEKIAETIPSSNVDYVDFTGLDINTDKLYILSLNVRNPQASAAALYIIVNGDTTLTNYYSQNLYASGATVGAAQYNAPWVSYIDAANRSACTVFIWRDPDGYFRWTSVITRATSSGLWIWTIAGSKTGTVTNITSIRVSASVAGGIGANSVLMLCNPRTK